MSTAIDQRIEKKIQEVAEAQYIRDDTSLVGKAKHAQGVKVRILKTELSKLIKQSKNDKIDVETSVAAAVKKIKDTNTPPQAPDTKYSLSNRPQNPHQVNTDLLKLQTPAGKKKADAEKDKWKKQMRDFAEKEEAKLLKEQQEKEISHWKKKSVEVANKIQQLKTSLEFDIEESTVRNLINEIRPDTTNVVQNVTTEKLAEIKNLTNAYKDYIKRKEQHEAEAEKKQKRELELNSIKPIKIEVDDFIKNRFDEETYKSYVEVAGIKIIETQIKKDYDKLLSEKLNTLNLTLKESKAELDNLRKKLRKAYTDFLSKLNKKTRAIEKKKRDEEKKQRALEQKRKAEVELKKKRAAELDERLRKKSLGGRAS